MFKEMVNKLQGNGSKAQVQFYFEVKELVSFSNLGFGNTKLRKVKLKVYL